MKIVLTLLWSLICVVVSIAIVEADGPPLARRPRRGPPAIPTKYLTPNDSVIAATADCNSISVNQRCNIRYLSLYNIPDNDRVKWIQTINLLLNSLSRARLIKHVYVVPGTNNSLLRLDITDYQFHSNVDKKVIGWNPKVWDRLGELDVYFNSIKIKEDHEVTTQRIKKIRQVPTGKKIYYSNGFGGLILRDEYITEEYYEDKVINVDTIKRERVRESADWVNKIAYANLQTATQSLYPIIRADFFNATASLPPFYHDFLEFGNKVEDFLAAVVLTKEDIKKAQLEIKGVVIKSGAGMAGKVIPVSENNRFVSRTQGPYGYVWRTRDVAAVKDITDYLRTLNEGKFDASEWIATGRNGLQWYFLSDKNDNRQDEAPINIVRDNTNEDRRVRNGRSCITCHFRGINEFAALPQAMVKDAIDVISPHKKKIKELREAFIGNIGDYFIDDNRIYSKAVALATTVVVDGKPHYLESEDNARQFGALYNYYATESIDINRAAYECGVPVKYLVTILASAKNDPYLLGLSRSKPLYAVPRVHWERSFQQAMLLVTKAAEATKK